MRLSPAQQRVLLAMAEGHTLKSHRFLDGRKIYRLHHLDGSTSETVWRTTVEALWQRGLVDSNKKFPAATYLLTEQGRRLAAELKGDEALPLSAAGWQA